MIDNEQQSREKMLSQFIDELNQEKTPLQDGWNVDTDEELCQLFDTVKAVKSLKKIQVPKAPPLFKENIRKNRMKRIIKYSSLASCLIIAVIAFFGINIISTGNKALKESICYETSHINGIAKDEANSSLSTEESQVTKGSSPVQLEGEQEKIENICSSCSGAERLLMNLPENMKITRILRLTGSQYKYYVRCTTDNSFMDFYILSDVNDYNLTYTGHCFSFIGGVLEENSSAGMEPYGFYKGNITFLTWSGEDFTIVIAANKPADETMTMLENATGDTAVPMSQQQIDQLKKDK